MFLQQVETLLRSTQKWSKEGIAFGPVQQNQGEENDILSQDKIFANHLQASTKDVQELTNILFVRVLGSARGKAQDLLPWHLRFSINIDRKGI